MSCRRVSRELLERFRFVDELDASSEPHLLHLQSCASCRAEVGLDRALVVQLRRALLARVGDATPPVHAWDRVRTRALASDPRSASRASPWRWMRLVPAAAVMTAMVLAVSLAPDSERPLALQVEIHNERGYLGLPPPEPEWEMPWWLAARTGSPPAPPLHGHLVMTIADANPPTTVGPFAELLQ